MRLQVALAHAGCASRRRCADIIKSGAVSVNGKVVTEPGYGIDLSKDKIRYRGRAIGAEKKIYIILHKPKGVITTTIDTHNRPTVLGLLPKIPYRLYHVGRLDKESSGLLFMTNDGEAAFRLAHPRFEVKRVYEVAVQGRLADDTIAKLEKGGRLGAAPCAIHVLKRNINNTLISISLHEGKKRQIRIMFERANHPVISLKRISFGPLRLGGVKKGAYRYLTEQEIINLKKELKME